MRCEINRCLLGEDIALERQVVLNKVIADSRDAFGVLGGRDGLHLFFILGLWILICWLKHLKKIVIQTSSVQLHEDADCLVEAIAIKYAAYAFGRGATNLLEALLLT